MEIPAIEWLMTPVSSFLSPFPEFQIQDSSLMGYGSHYRSQTGSWFIEISSLSLLVSFVYFVASFCSSARVKP